MEFERNIPWEDHADEHVLFMRPNNAVSPDAFEFVRVTSSGDIGFVNWLHGMVYIDDYLQTYERAPERLDAILAGFGYDDLDDLCRQTGTGPEDLELVRKPDGTIDRANSPGYVVDLRLLASLICESLDSSEVIPVDVAVDEVKRIVGQDMAEFIKDLGGH